MVCMVRNVFDGKDVCRILHRLQKRGAALLLAICKPTDLMRVRPGAPDQIPVRPSNIAKLFYLRLLVVQAAGSKDHRIRIECSL